MFWRDPKTYVILVLTVLCLFLWLSPGAENSAQQHTTDPSQATQSAEPTIWTCSMHPQIQQPEPGLCPLCGMDLIPLLANDQADTGTWELKLTPAAKARAGIQTATVKREAIERRLELVGKVLLDEKRLTTISSRVAGRIDRMFIDYTGMQVRKGDHMVTIYSPDLVTAYQELKSVQRAMTTDHPAMRDAATRRLQLVRDKLRLLGMPDDRILALEQGESDAEQITVDSPVRGIVIAKHLNEGSYIKEGTPLYTVADLSRVWVAFQAYESDLVWLRFGQKLSFSIDAYPGETFEGRISFIDPLLNPVTRTVSVRLEMDNAQGRLKPQMLARGHVISRFTAEGAVLDPDLEGKWISPMHPEIVKDGPGPCDVCGMPLVRAEELGFATDMTEGAPLVIPESAALLTGEDAVVYVATNEEATRFAGRRVVLGPKSNNMFVVQSGLEAGDQVVVHGAFKIDSELQIRAAGSMMYPPQTDQKHNHGDADADLSTLQAFDPTPSFVAELAPLYATFFAMQHSLSLDQFDAKLATTMANAIEKVAATSLEQGAAEAWRTWRAGTVTTLERFVAAADLAAARAVFEDLNRDVERLFAQFGAPPEQPLFRYHCPMAFENRGADWLQQEQGTANPYYGSMMFRCGSQTAVLQQGGNDE